MMGHPCCMGEYARLMQEARRRRVRAWLALFAGYGIAGALTIGIYCWGAL